MDALKSRNWLEATEPFTLLHDWMEEARRQEVNDPDAMTLATVDSSGVPDARIVLLKEIEPNGLIFYTNRDSTKGQELRGQPWGAGVLHWKSLRRQVRFRGTVAEAESEQADAYFATRARQSRIGAWASRQSEPLESRSVLERQTADFERQFEGIEPPRPPFWVGYRIVPFAFEFWSDGAFRLHDRLQFMRSAPEADWTCQRLYP